MARDWEWERKEDLGQRSWEINYGLSTPTSGDIAAQHVCLLACVVLCHISKLAGMNRWLWAAFPSVHYVLCTQHGVEPLGASQETTGQLTMCLVQPTKKL